MLPMRTSGSTNGPGRVSPDAATATPAREPIAIGLRRGVVSRRAADTGSPGRLRSRTVRASGVTTICWRSRMGATSEASPRTYTAMGMPRFPALT